MKRSRGAILVFCAIVAIATTTCENPMLATVTAVVTEHQKPKATVNFESGSGLAEDTEIVITFTGSINPATLELGGIIGGAASGVWSAGTDEDGEPIENAVLTIRPTEKWPLGSGKDLVVTGADAQEFALDPIEATYGVLDGVVYVHARDGNDLNPGTIDQPKKSIAAAVREAERVYDTAEVRVAEGTYQSSTPVTVSRYISLYGGYSADDWTVREGNKHWAVTGTRQSAYPTVIKIVFVSTGAQGERPYTLHIQTGNASSIEIDGFYLTGGAGDNSVAVLIDNCSPVLRSNRIDAGSGRSSVAVAGNYGGSIIEYNFIYGGENEYSTAILNFQSDAVIRHNTIAGGTGSATKGILNISSSATIAYNKIHGGDARDSSEGIGNEAGSDTLIYNNTIDAGGGTWTTGIRNKGSSPTIRNNTISGGGGSILSGSTADAVWNYNSSNPVLDNNIIFTTSGDYQFGITQGDGSSVVASLRNNAFFGSIHYIYNDLHTGELDCEPPASSGDIGANALSAVTNVSGNFYTTSPPGDVLVTVSGTAMNWRLKTIETEITEGGLDGFSNGWGFNDDLDGLSRTGNGSTGWSMGAYEKD